MKTRALLIFYFLTNFTLAWPSDQLQVDSLCSKAECFKSTLCFDSAAHYFYLARLNVDVKSDAVKYCRLSNQFAESLFWQDKMMECAPLCFDNLKKCRELLGNDHLETAKACINMGAFKFVNNGHGLTKEYFEEAARIYTKLYGTKNPALAKTDEWLGTYYENNADTLKSRAYLWKSYELWAELKGADHTDLAEICRYMGLYFKRFGKHDSAMIFFDKSKYLFDEKYGPANFQSVKCLNNMADIFAEHDSLLHLVVPTYRTCDSLISLFPSPNRMAEVMTLYNKAEFERSNHNDLKAIGYMNKILKKYFPNFNNTGIYANPTQLVDYPNHIVKLALLFKANTFKGLAKKDSNNYLKYLEAAHNNYEALDNLMDEMRTHINNFDHLLFVSHRNAPIYDQMVEVEIRLFEITKNTAYLNNALQYISKKTHSIKTNLSEDFAWKYLNGSNSTFLKIKDLDQEINILKRGLYSSVHPDQSKYAIIQKSIEKDLLHFEMANTAQANFESFSRIYDISIQAIQEKLGPDESLLVFSEKNIDCTAMSDMLLIIAISREKVLVKQIEDNEIFHVIRDFNQKIAAEYPIETILGIGTQIYKLLIEPFEEILSKQIYLVASASLSQLPFEVLPDLKNSSAEQAQYMIFNYTISKVYLLSDFLNDNPQTANFQNDSLLAVAPVFDKSKIREIALLTKRDASMINLAGAIQECEKISAYFNTKLLSGIHTSKSTFKSLCQNYPYIHISTHGVPAKDDVRTMKLAFSPQPEDEGWLTFYDILNLDLRSEMVVLSACKTGVGKANNGEGNLNLAWAFRQAGAKSSVIALWDVNDYASAQIMPAFYKNINTGQSRPEALRNAKLEYLATHDASSGHPYYWAAFDYTGDSSEKHIPGIVFLKHPALLYILLVMLLGIIAATFIAKHLKREKISTTIFQ